ncbi:MAG: DUF4175 family protein [Hyphomicrobiaceae bacterium]
MLANLDVAEATRTLVDLIDVRIVGAGQPTWRFRVTPDKAPVIHLTKEPQRLPRGSLKLTCKVEDDYGVVSAEAQIRRVPQQPGDPATEWAA